ncbi:hypothetical protein EYF80_049078 [Liparis tanakae]|uniref:Uncharacterized protein n=1 Tax=Liparis tanakae TaxID=230148 RepID=A0A4Z2FJ11_9TELE|nr:hypothetical protein EYF80_049078 [Liparis tanakae]
MALQTERPYQATRGYRQSVIRHHGATDRASVSDNKGLQTERHIRHQGVTDRASVSDKGYRQRWTQT